MARPRKQITDEHLRQIETLAGYGLTEAAIAAVVGISPRLLRQRKTDSDAVSAALENGKAKAQAVIGQCLFEKARAGDLGAIVWWEKTRAGRRETVKQEITGADGAPAVVFYLPDNRRGDHAA
jgi:hypothetical protein